MKKLIFLSILLIGCDKAYNDAEKLRSQEGIKACLAAGGVPKTHVTNDEENKYFIKYDECQLKQNTVVVNPEGK